MGTVQYQDDDTSSSKPMVVQVQQYPRQRRKALQRLYSALALSVLLGHGGLDHNLGEFMNVADALPAPGPPQPYHHHQAVLSAPFLGETTFTTARTQEGEDATNPTIFRVLLEHSTSKNPSKGKNHKDNTSKKITMNQNGQSGQDQQHQNFLNLASRVSGKSTHQIDQELQKERERVQKEHQAHFQSLQQQKQQLEQLRKQKQEQKLEDDVDDAAAEEEGGREGGKEQQRRRVHGKGAGRIRLPTDVTQPSKGREKCKKKGHGHDTDHDHGREMADHDDDEYEERDEDEDRDKNEERDEDEDEEDEDEGDEAVSFARHPQRHHRDKAKSKKSSSKENTKNQKQSREESRRNSEGAMEYQLQKRKSTPTIFYVPHQDDDALAMALGKNPHMWFFFFFSTVFNSCSPIWD